MNESDLLLVLGASFRNHTGISAGKPIIQVDFDAMTLGKFHPVDLPVLGEIGLTAEWLWRALPEDTGSVDQLPALAERWRIWRDEGRAPRARSVARSQFSHAVRDPGGRCPLMQSSPSASATTPTRFGRYFPNAEASPVPDVRLPGVDRVRFSRRRWVPWAATLAQPDYRGRKVVSVSGDGGFGQYMAEFTTAVIRHVDHARRAQQRGTRQISRSSAPVTGRCGETTLRNPISPPLPKFAAVSGYVSDNPDELHGALNGHLPTKARRFR